jgi:hypothetical protein
MNLCDREYTLILRFRSDQETANTIRDSLQITADALVTPTKKTTRALLELSVNIMAKEVREQKG